MILQQFEETYSRKQGSQPDLKNSDFALYVTPSVIKSINELKSFIASPFRRLKNDKRYRMRSLTVSVFSFVYFRTVPRSFEIVRCVLKAWC